jgi:uncharacterized membrane protein YsdA (DUF1294 family)
MHRAIRVRVALGLVALMIASVLIGGVPLWLLVPYAVSGAVSAALYGFDKLAAQGDGWRTRESTLQFVDLLFGIIGGLLAHEGFRHKTAKRDFATATWTIAAVHGIGLAALTLVGWQRTMGILAALAAATR